jgi:hypothetical protein
MNKWLCIMGWKTCSGKIDLFRALGDILWLGCIALIVVIAIGGVR